MFDSVFSMFAVFQILFVVVFILVVITIIYRIVKSRNLGQQLEGMPTVIKEREIIKEVVKIRCPYCNSLYNETEDKCPTCGAKRQ